MRRAGETARTSRRAVVLGLLAAAPAQAASVRTTPELIAAVAAAQPGDTIQVLPGTYSLDTSLVLSRPGPVRLVGAGRAEEIILAGRTAAVIVVRAQGWTVRGLTLQGALGVRVEDTGSGVRLSGLRVADTPVGIELGEAADFTCALSGVVLENNVFARLSSEAIRFNSVCSAQVVHQTVWGVTRPVLVQGPSLPPSFANNLWSGPVLGAGASDIQLPQVSSTDWFVTAAPLDLHLRTGARPIDVGVVTQTADDADGQPRPVGAAPDVGAFEYRPPASAMDAASAAEDGGLPGPVPIGGYGHAGRPQEAACAVRPGRAGGTRGESLLGLLLLAALLRRRR